MSNRKNRKKERGASMLEFAIICMLVFTIIFGIIEFGWMFSNMLTLQAASHQGARAAAIGKDAPTVTTAINNSTTTLTPADLSVRDIMANPGDGWVTWTPGTVPPGGTSSQVRVRLQYNYHCLTFVGRALPGTTDGVRVLRAETVMRFGG